MQQSGKHVSMEEYQQLTGQVGKKPANTLFENVQIVDPNVKSELLSVSEAKELGVPFGTTREQAAALGITPSDKKEALEAQRQLRRKDQSFEEAQRQLDEGLEIFKLQDDRNRLLAAGLADEDINIIASDIAQFGVDAAIENFKEQGMTKAQEKAIRNVLSGVTPTQEQKQEEDKQFLNVDYFKNLFTKDQLKEEAKKAGFTEGGFLGIGVGQEGIDNYLEYLINSVEQYRQAGYTDKEILKQMQ